MPLISRLTMIIKHDDKSDFLELLLGISLIMNERNIRPYVIGCQCFLRLTHVIGKFR
jgi:hypothetical protein